MMVGYMDKEHSVYTLTCYYCMCSPKIKAQHSSYQKTTRHKSTSVISIGACAVTYISQIHLVQKGACIPHSSGAYGLAFVVHTNLPNTGNSVQVQ